MRHPLSLDQDLGFAFEVVVEFLAGMPVPVKGRVRRYFDKIDEHLTARDEVLVERLVQEVRHLGLRQARSEAGAGKEGGGDAKYRGSNRQETHTAPYVGQMNVRVPSF